MPNLPIGLVDDDPDHNAHHDALHRRFNQIVDPLDYGAVGDGVADDTVAIEDALDDWITRGGVNNPGTLVFPAGHDFRITRELTIAPSTYKIGGKIIGHGARLVMDGADDYGLHIDCATGGQQLRNLTISGLHFEGCGVRLTSGNSGSAAVYGFSLEGLDFEQFEGHGIFIDGGFEGQIAHCHLIAAPTNITNDCIHLEDVSGGNVSSIDVVACTTRNGRHGLYDVNGGDVAVFGGTYIECQKAGIHLNNHSGRTVTGVHVENCHEDGLESVRAGIKIVGRASVQGCYGVANNGQMQYVVQVYAGSSAAIIGGLQVGLTSYVYVDGAANASVVLAGLHSWTAASGFLTTRAGRVVELGVEGGATHRIYNANLTVDKDLTASQRVLLADGTGGQPGLSFVVDSNTGIYRLGADVMGFAAGGSLRAGVDTTRFFTDGGVDLHVNGGAWNLGRLRLGNYHLWVDGSGRLRIKSGAPASDTDGTVVGTQA